MSVRRQFRGVRGTLWTAHLFDLPDGSRTSVLRFETEGVTLELREYPLNWYFLTDAELAELARRAQPPRRGMGPA